MSADGTGSQLNPLLDHANVYLSGINTLICFRKTVLEYMFAEELIMIIRQLRHFDIFRPNKTCQQDGSKQPKYGLHMVNVWIVDNCHEHHQEHIICRVKLMNPQTKLGHQVKGAQYECLQQCLTLLTISQKS